MTDIARQPCPKCGEILKVTIDCKHEAEIESLRTLFEGQKEESGKVIADLRRQTAELSKDRHDLLEANEARQARNKRMSNTIESLRTALRKIISMCGNPDAADGCRNVIKLSQEAIKSIGGDGK